MNFPKRKPIKPEKCKICGSNYRVNNHRIFPTKYFPYLYDFDFNKVPMCSKCSIKYNSLNTDLDIKFMLLEKYGYKYKF